MDRSTAADTIVKRKKGSMVETSHANYVDKAMAEYSLNKFTPVWKKYTSEYAKALLGPKMGKRGKGAKEYTKRYNEQLKSPGDYKIKKTRLIKAMKNEDIGTTTKKIGRPPIVPAQLNREIAAHATMMQVNGEAEESGPKMTATIISLSHWIK